MQTNSFSQFLSSLNDNYKLLFGMPKSDTYQKCDMLKNKIKC